MRELGGDAFACEVCGSIYRDRETASACEAAPVEPERIAPGTLVAVHGGGPGTGPGYVRKSYLLGMDDPRGPAHARLYRASFVWGSGDFRAGDLEDRGPVSEADWRAAVERGPERAG